MTLSRQVKQSCSIVTDSSPPFGLTVVLLLYYMTMDTGHVHNLRLQGLAVKAKHAWYHTILAKHTQYRDWCLDSILLPSRERNCHGK